MRFENSRIAKHSIILTVVAYATWGCGTSSDGGGSGGIGGSASGGTVSGSATGGAVAMSGTVATGGTVATTGNSSGGTAAVGSNTGGATPSGTATGGTSTGSKATGGSATGGSIGTGGTSGGAGGSSNGYPLGNPAVPSTGCGKALSSFAKGNTTYKMKSAGLDREYIVGVPQNYDPNTPYRLVFGMHPMGGSANGIRDGHWYDLQPLDTKGNTIWVAPQGYTDGAPWRGDDKDHLFFDDLLKLLQSELCIDTSRVFMLGWSFGSMITNSLAQTHQNVLRGVVVYSTADYNIYFPTNTGKPLAYMGVHGIYDNLCPLDAGRRSAKRFVANNGCTDETAPEAAYNTKHVSHQFKCPSNYPVRWVTFSGGHMCVASDPGESTNWVPGETWQFIAQF